MDNILKHTEKNYDANIAGKQKATRKANYRFVCVFCHHHNTWEFMNDATNQTKREQK